VAVLLVAGIVAAVVARARRLVARQAEAAAQRAVLARYFSPNLVDEIGRHRGSLTQARATDAAVLFADVRGFTALAEKLTPEQTLALLREVHGRIAQAVFRHEGTLDKFTGDGAMALFGAPRPGTGDAAQALRAARDLLGSLRAWNATRRADGQAEVQVGIGLHWGPVVTGNVGDARRLDFTAIGDTVNLAARLEQLTRELDADLVASVAFCDRAAAAGADVADLVDAGARHVKGRGEPVALRLMRRGAPAGASMGTG
jgi:adenylate cyclase